MRVEGAGFRFVEPDEDCKSNETPTHSEVLHACIKENGNVRFVISPDFCKASEIPLDVAHLSGGGLNIPVGDLTVAGSIDAGGPTFEVGNSIRINGFNDTIEATSGTVNFTNDNLVTTGRIGISTLVPQESLHVVGNTRIDNGDLICGNACVHSADLADGEVNTVDLADGAVTLAKVGADAVDSSKVIDGSITDADLAETYAKIDAAGAVSGFGTVPIGTIVVWHKDMFPTPPLPDGWLFSLN